MNCELCGKLLASEAHIRVDGETRIVCYGCRDKMEVQADFEYQRQKEEGLV